MNYVEPIRELQKVNDIADYLKRTNPRNYIMYEIGIYTGLRISDILRLKVADTKGKNIYIKEKKTGKMKNVEINKALKKDFDWYCFNRTDDEYLVKSREGENKPITRDMALKIIKEVGEKFDIQNVGTHTLRKTFGYHHYKRTKDIAVLQKLYNHSSPSVTLRYIGIVQDTLNEAVRNISYR